MAGVLALFAKGGYLKKMPNPSRTNDSLTSFRTQAAEQTSGISSNTIYRPILELVEEMNLTGDLLDYGAGAGNLTRKLVQTGRFKSITAADLLHPGEPMDGVRYLAQDLNEALEEPDKSFDVLISSEVIEHLENPRAVLRDWYRLLRPGGTLILSTPNVESWKSIFMLAVRGQFASFTDKDYPAHITALLRIDFQRIFKEVGFGDLRFRYTDSGLIPFVSPLRWQQFSFGLLRGARFSDTIVAVSVRP